ncbi:long-chain-fatty-acid--CoA ligase [Caldalkalibacillus thermarum]|uniref:class I adenylate-forming enzyme family protein n=1 Tax=Caldalkalibacillus thermarum TaxID=296745 RepID=UPI0016693547|nr:AMP-binding protein [Caldalkalibacillus thermarum]GGK30713.1 long-chain-fatty-acid--CoA ligase [Caldalkalibacillus thermarum]
MSHHSKAKGLLYSSQYLDVVNQLRPELQHVEEYLVLEPGGSDPALEAILSQYKGSYETKDGTEEDVAVIFYTSGTTGRPKGVMLTHRNCVAVSDMWATAFELTAQDQVQIVAPLFHCAASHVFMLPAMYAGGTVVIEPGFSPKQSLKTMAEQKVTVFFGVPAMYTLLLNEPGIEQVNVPHLRLLTYGAAPMPYELVKKVKQRFPQVKVQNCYGQTENAPGATTLKDLYALEKIGSVGEPLPNCEVRVVDEHGQDVPVGEVGEIIVKGLNVMKGYLYNPEATQEAIKDGWLYSGDLGRLDEDGLLYIVDRKKDMIIRGGENVYPVEIEEVLYEIPEILEAAVVGIPHEVYGEVPKAYVVLKDGQSISEETILNYCWERLAKYKVPAEVEFIAALPRNASGKVLKTVLRGEIKFA